MENNELTAYLNQLLSATFVLDDGTRVKSVDLKWDELSTDQIELAVLLVKKVCVKELKSLKPNAKLHIEFNEIPEEMSEMLNDLGGDDNPEFTWGLIPENNS